MQRSIISSFVCTIFHPHVSRWVIESRLDKLEFARQKLAYRYFSGAATFFSPELSDARISWTKSMVLAKVVDDFFDIGSSEEELVNLIQLVKKYVLPFSHSFLESLISQ